MKEFLRLFSLCATVAVVAWWNLAPRTTASERTAPATSTRARPPAVPAIPHTSATIAPAVTAAPVGGVVVAIRNATTAVDALDSLEQLEAEQPAVAAEFEADVAAACHRFPGEGRLIAINADNQWVMDRLKTYCERYSSARSLSDLTARAMAEGRRAETAAALAEIMSRSGLEAAKASAAEIVAVAADPYSLDEAMRYLTTSDGGWDLGADLPDSLRLGISLVDAQALAVKMYECELFGGCGPRDLLTLTHCAGVEVCRPDDGFLDLLRSTSKPVDYRLAERLLVELRVRRRRAVLPN
ncbi:MAG TPA: hypothetical protein VJ724_13385 [Tahibacter sp.]|nr:hypothetical protein [Tahibacter sp.]